MEDFFALLEWPAMAISLAAAWWMGSKKANKRVVAFVMLSIGNLMWIAWGWGNRRGRSLPSISACLA